MTDIPFGYCQCGCGGRTRVSKYNDTTHGYISGVPRLFINHHRAKGNKSPSWNGGKIKNNFGYVKVMYQGHPRADESGYILEHIILAEKALGRFLVEPECVHHINLIKSDNRNSNLIICPDNAYHHLIHNRERALVKCGHVSWRKCRYCKQYSDPYMMQQAVGKNQFCHKECLQNYHRKYRKNHQEKAATYGRNYYRANKEKWSKYNQKQGGVTWESICQQ